MNTVYVIVNKINGKMYVGCTTKKYLCDRFGAHVYDAKNGSNFTIHKAIRKYGSANFNIRMIEEYQTREDMLKGEVEWIRYFNTYGTIYGYNATPGGEYNAFWLGKKMSETTKQKMSKSQIKSHNPKSNYNLTFISSKKGMTWKIINGKRVWLHAS